MKKQILFLIIAVSVISSLILLLPPRFYISSTPIRTSGPLCQAIGCNIKDVSMREDRGWPLTVYQTKYYNVNVFCAYYQEKVTESCKHTAERIESLGFNIYSFTLNVVVLYGVLNVVYFIYKFFNLKYKPESSRKRKDKYPKNRKK